MKEFSQPSEKVLLEKVFIVLELWTFFLQNVSILDAWLGPKYASGRRMK